MDQDIDQERYRLEKNQLMLDRKTLTEKIVRLKDNRNLWLEPLKESLKDAETLRETVTSPSVLSKKSAALKIFGSNLFLKNRKIHFTPLIPWAALHAAIEKNKKNSSCILLERVAGIEPASSPWQGDVLPLNHTRLTSCQLAVLNLQIVHLKIAAQIFWCLGSESN